jgi:hypothetical protein
MKTSKLFLIAVLIIFSGLLKAQNLSISNPEEIGFSSEKKNPLGRRILRKTNQ